MEIINQEPTAYIEEQAAYDLSEKYKEAKAISFLRVVAGCLAVTTATLGFAIAAMMPLKSTVPYLVRDNDATGVPEIITVMQEQIVGYDEARDKSAMAQYVRNYESYDPFNIVKYYRNVGITSSPAVGAEYAQRYNNKNEEALHKILGDKYAMVVDIRSIEPGVVMPGVEGGSGRVSYKLSKVEIRTGKVVEFQYLIATFGFEYQNTLKMDQDIRLENPYGFTVNFFKRSKDGLGGKS